MKEELYEKKRQKNLSYIGNNEIPLFYTVQSIIITAPSVYDLQSLVKLK